MEPDYGNQTLKESRRSRRGAASPENHNKKLLSKLTRTFNRTSSKQQICSIPQDSHSTKAKKNKSKGSFHGQAPSQKDKHLNQSFNKKVRESNKRYVSRSNSAENIRTRLPWGVDSCRLNNYVLETLVKMQKMRKNVKDQDKMSREKSKMLDQSITENTPDKKYLKNGAQKLGKTFSIKNQTENTIPKNRSMLAKSRSKKKGVQMKSSEYQIVSSLPQMVALSFKNSFLTLEKNQIFSLNFRILNRTVMEIQIAVVRPLEKFCVILNKGSLQCQSVAETYEKINSKSSIILMIAVYSCPDSQNYQFPVLRLEGQQKSGSFMETNVILPYCWLNLIEIIDPSQLEHWKVGKGKIKNKSMIESIPPKEIYIDLLKKIFDNKMIKQKSVKRICYRFGFSWLGKNYQLAYIIDWLGKKSELQCEAELGANPSSILQFLDFLFAL